MLELSLLYPDAVGLMILLNGFHGHVFQTAFQPLVRLPGVGSCLNWLVEALLSRQGDLLRNYLLKQRKTWGNACFYEVIT